MSKQKTIDEIQAGWDGLIRPQEGQIFQHYKGSKYEIVATGFLEDSEAPCRLSFFIKKYRVGAYC